MSIFSERLKTLREEYGLSLNDVATKCGISKSSVHLYEVGTRKPKYKALEELSCLFNVDIEYLTGQSDIKNAAANQLGYESLKEAYAAGVDLGALTQKQTAPTEPELSEGEQMLIKLFRQIPPEQQPSAIEMLRSALKVAGILQ